MSKKSSKKHVTKRVFKMEMRTTRKEMRGTSKKLGLDKAVESLNRRIDNMAASLLNAQAKMGHVLNAHVTTEADRIVDRIDGLLKQIESRISRG